MEKKLPVYQIEIDENDETTGVDFISLVDEPAMELNWLKFNKEVKLEFKADKDKKLLYGVFIVPDKMIYRNDDRMGEYYTYFSKDTIEKIVKKFNKNNFNKNINFQHGDNRVNGFVVENFITSPMLKADFGFEIPEGSWVGSVYIEDDNFWQNYIKNGDLNGFSVEIISKLQKIDMVENEFAEVYTDYPQAATENAKIALRWAEKNGWGSCGTPVGKTRANQLANREGISRETISRMAAFERHRQNSQKALGDGCGRLMWLAWGGDEGVAWAQRKLEQIDKQKLSKTEKIDELYDELVDILKSPQPINDVYNRLENLFKK
jgi:hypothetical protein